MLLKIRHETTYNYDGPVDYALQKLRLRPAASHVQTIDHWDIQIEGGTTEVEYADHYGNLIALVSTTSGSQLLKITTTGQVQTHDGAGIFGRVYGQAPLWHFECPTVVTTPNDAIRELAAGMAKHTDKIEGLHALSTSILSAVPYQIGKTDVGTTAQEALQIGNGVCQDHANIFVSAARAAGLPARYVSGYLMMNETIDQDASHAWAEVHVDPLGWVGFDVSNGVSPDERYVRLAVGRDSTDAAPVSGLRQGTAGESLVVSLQVQQ